MLDPAGRVATWNSGAERFQGYHAAEIIGRDHSCFFPPEAIAAGLPMRDLALAERDGHFEDEGWRVRKDGSRYWANVILTTLRDRDQKLIGFGKVIRDFTERMRSVEQFRLAIEASRQAAHFLESIPNQKLEKPFKAAQLCAVVRQMLSSNPPSPAHLKPPQHLN